MAERPKAATADVLPVKTSVIGLAWLGLFSLFYSVGEEMGAWPKWPLGELSDLDLVFGFLAAAAVLVAFLVPVRAGAESGERRAAS